MGPGCDRPGLLRAKFKILNIPVLGFGAEKFYAVVTPLEAIGVIFGA